MVLLLLTEREEPMDWGNDGGREDPRRRSAPREEKEGRQIFRAPHGTGRRDEDIYYGGHRSGIAPSGFWGDQGCRDIPQLQGHTREDAERSGEVHCAAGATGMVRRMVPAPGAFAIMEGRIAALEAENEVLWKRWLRAPRQRRAARQRVSPWSNARWNARRS